jgi:hypothetical protein
MDGGRPVCQCFENSVQPWPVCDYRLRNGGERGERLISVWNERQANYEAALGNSTSRAELSTLS